MSTLSPVIYQQQENFESWNYQILKHRFRLLRNKFPTDDYRSGFILAFAYELKGLKNSLKDELKDDKSLNDLHNLLINVNKFFDIKNTQDFDVNFKSLTMNTKIFTGIYKIVENCLGTLTKFQ